MPKVLHRVSLSMTDPKHPHVHKRGEKIAKTIRLGANDRIHAMKRAKEHYTKQGYKVSEVDHLGTVTDDGETKK